MGHVGRFGFELIIILWKRSGSCMLILLRGVVLRLCLPASTHPREPFWRQDGAFFLDKKVITWKLSTHATAVNTMTINAIESEAVTCLVSNAAARTIPLTIDRATSAIKTAFGDKLVIYVHVNSIQNKSRRQHVRFGCFRQEYSAIFPCRVHLTAVMFIAK